jgi:hypothetical protein
VWVEKGVDSCVLPRSRQEKNNEESNFLHGWLSDWDDSSMIESAGSSLLSLPSLMGKRHILGGERPSFVMVDTVYFLFPVFVRRN